MKCLINSGVDKFSLKPLLHTHFYSILSSGHLALASQGVLVKQVLRHLVVVGIHAGQVGDVVTKLLDGLHLLVQVVGLQEIAQLKQNC